MKRSSVNFIIDLVSLLNLLALISTGTIMRWVLPPGTGGLGRQLHGGGGRGQQIKQFWSLGRHEWGSVHFWLAVGFVTLMVVHIVLHWAWIKGYLKCHLLQRAK
jgi:hypothetical protein